MSEQRAELTAAEILAAGREPAAVPALAITKRTKPCGFAAPGYNAAVAARVHAAGGAAVPAEKRSYAVDNTLARRAGRSGGAASALSPLADHFFADSRAAAAAGRLGAAKRLITVQERIDAAAVAEADAACVAVAAGKVAYLNLKVYVVMGVRHRLLRALKVKVRAGDPDMRAAVAPARADFYLHARNIGVGAVGETLELALVAFIGNVFLFAGADVDKRRKIVAYFDLSGGSKR